MKLLIKKKNFSLSLLFLVVLVSSCASKYKVEESPILDFSEAYYQKWTAGVKGGGAGINIFLTLKPEINLKDENIKIDGIYFKEFYTDLKFYPPTKFQGVIKTKENSNITLDIFGENATNSKPDKTIENEVEMPFKLENDEAVVSFKKKGSQKYLKITLTKKDLLNVPM